jgi:hypothetical protein
MNKRLLLALLPALIGVLFSAASARAGVGEFSGDLTVTVEELANGEVRFTLSGAAQIKENGTIYATPQLFDPDRGGYIPPANRQGYDLFPLPGGLSFELGDFVASEEEAAGPEEGGNPTFPVNYIEFSTGGWYLRMTSGGVSSGALLTGSGSVTVSSLDSAMNSAEGEIGEAISEPFTFADLVPGVYQVSGHLFDFTYVVVPYGEVVPISAPKRNASIFLSRLRPFPPTGIGRRSLTQVVRIRNRGDAPLRGLSVGASGRASKDFSVSPPKRRTLAPGAGTTVRVSFRPSAPGFRRASLNAKGNAPTASTALLGRGVAPSPRAPLRPLK